MAFPGVNHAFIVIITSLLFWFCGRAYCVSEPELS